MCVRRACVCVCVRARVCVCACDGGIGARQPERHYTGDATVHGLLSTLRRHRTMWRWLQRDRGRKRLLRQERKQNFVEDPRAFLGRWVGIRNPSEELQPDRGVEDGVAGDTGQQKDRIDLKGQCAAALDSV